MNDWNQRIPKNSDFLKVKHEWIVKCEKKDLMLQ